MYVYRFFQVLVYFRRVITPACIIIRCVFDEFCFKAVFLAILFVQKIAKIARIPKDNLDDH